MTCLVEKGKSVDLVYLDFGKAFDTNSHTILLEKLTAHGLDGCTVSWVKIWLDGCAKKVVGNGVNSMGGWSLVVFPRGQYWSQSHLISSHFSG